MLKLAITLIAMLHVVVAPYDSMSCIIFRFPPTSLQELQKQRE